MIVQQILNGLTIGTIYALLALGYSFIFGVLSFINFAHGAVAMLGGYSCWWAASKLGLPFIPAALFGIVVSMVFGVLMERVGYYPIRKSARLFMVIVSLGFSYIVSTSVLIIWGSQSVPFPQFIEAKTFNINGVILNTTQLWILALALFIMATLTIFINKSRMGIAMRAVALDQSTVGLMGVDINRVISFTFALGSALGAVSAIMMASYYGSIYPTLGNVIGNKGFAAVVLGGAGSIPGAMLGGLLLGISESMAATFLSSSMKELVAYIILIVVLLFKPAGLLGKDVVKE